MKRGIFLLLLCLLSGLKITIAAQEYNGITGLLQVPNAEADSAGTFRGGISWVDKRMLPDMSYYGDGIPFSAPCYTIGFSAWEWLQLSYTGTFVKTHGGNPSNELKYYNQDRHINIKLRPLKEGRWWPAVALGWDDIGSLKTLGLKESITTNNFFENLYVAASKHINVKGNELGVHLACRYYPKVKNRERRGVCGGVTVRPAFYKQLRGIVEWDGVGVNVGADVLLWRHLFVQAALAHGQGFSGGVGYHYTIKF